MRIAGARDDVLAILNNKANLSSGKVKRVGASCVDTGGDRPWGHQAVVGDRLHS